MQLIGLDEQVMKELFKHMSVNLCPNTLGQVMQDLNYEKHAILIKVRPDFLLAL